MEVAQHGFIASATNNVVTTANATWQLTGVQLEVGENLAFSCKAIGQHYKCQRYYFPSAKLQYLLRMGYDMGQWYTQYPKVNAISCPYKETAPSITYGQSNSGCESN